MTKPPKYPEATAQDAEEVSRQMSGLATLAAKGFNFPIVIALGLGGLDKGAVVFGICGLDTRSDLKKALRRALYSLDDPGVRMGGDVKGDA